MLTRYYRDNRGRLCGQAKIYTKDEHIIRKDSIDDDAGKICSRLTQNGYESYIVGGAVRDLLLGFHPKDFDIATSATPGEVRRIFRNSRIIGKRFRLVHIFFNGGKIYEVATFRALNSGDRNHVYGSIDEDVLRRDFSMNALYFDPGNEFIIDFLGGVKDIRNKVLRSVIPLDTTFSEDPVRMLRAIKYAAISGMRILPALGLRIKKQASLLDTTSSSRLSEELLKILRSGNSEVIFRFMHRYKLIEPMLPGVYREFHRGQKKEVMEETFLSLAKLDSENREGKLDSGYMLYKIAYPLIKAQRIFPDSREPARAEAVSGKPDYWEVVACLKNLLKPLVQPNRDVEEAVKLMFKDQQIHLAKGLTLPQYRRRTPRRRSDFKDRKEHDSGHSQ